MNAKQLHFIGTLAVTLFATTLLLAQRQETEISRGSHGGRLLEDGGFTVELAIFEQGVPPQYRAWAYSGDVELATDAWQLNVELSRLGGRVDSFNFSANGGFLLGDGVVEEPHSFDVAVTARFQGRAYNWEFESHEGRLKMS